VDIQRGVKDVQILAASWRKLLWVLAVTNVGSGLGIVLGPGNSRTSAAYRILEGVSIPYTAFALILVIGGALVLWERYAWLGHLFSAVSLGFWGGLIVFVSLIAKQPSSFGVAFWTLGLAGVHLVILYGRIYRHQFHSKIGGS
jgi:hypothetical protein